jgi:hypothetical protein
MKPTTRKPAPSPAPPNLSKIGQAVKMTFVTAIKRAMSCTDAEAEMKFAEMVRKGDVRECGNAGLLNETKKYIAKGIANK